MPPPTPANAPYKRRRALLALLLAAANNAPTGLPSRLVRDSSVAGSRIPAQPDQALFPLGFQKADGHTVASCSLLVHRSIRSGVAGVRAPSARASGRCARPSALRSVFQRESIDAPAPPTRMP